MLIVLGKYSYYSFIKIFIHDSKNLDSQVNYQKSAFDQMRGSYN
jgi:hypothetical protein